MNRLLQITGALLLGGAVIHAAESKIILKPGTEGTDLFFGWSYDRPGVNNDVLRVGGWGDCYVTLIKFPDLIEKMPNSFKRAELWLYHANTTRPTDIDAWLLTSTWSEQAWDHANLSGYKIGRYPGPQIGSGWYGLDVTTFVNYWRQNPSINNGWCFYPAATDNRFDEFYSSDSTSGSLRPELHLVYDVASTPALPNLKMPLPGGKEWKLTVEAGGEAYDGIPDQFHMKTTWYSLDFGTASRPIGGGTTINETEIPVLAMGSGTVVEVNGMPNKDPYTLNGYRVKIDHNVGALVKSGFQTVYCHLKNPPSVRVGQIVSQGQILGIMGNTGMWNGNPYVTHLHVTCYYHDTATGNGSDVMLNQIRIDNLFIKDYQLFSPI